MYNFKRYPCLMLILVASILNTHAQDQKSMKNLADEHFLRLEYRQAALMYEKLIKKDKSQTAMLQKIGISYKQMNEYEKAAEWYRIIVSRPDATPNDLLVYGDLLKNLGDYKAAKDIYNRHSQKGSLMVSRRIVSCDSAMKWIDQPTSGKVSNLSAVNTSASDWGAVMNNQKNLIFISDSLWKSSIAKQLEGGNKMKYQPNGRSYLKLFQYNGVSNQSNGSVTEFSALLNDFDYHVGPLIFDKGDSLVFFTVTNTGKIDKRKNPYGIRRLEIYSSKLQKGSWTKPVSFAFNNNEFSVGHPALSADGNILYFSSDMPGGQGKTDIWYCERLPDGSWGLPVNCGPEINTAEEEEFPTINKELLYFSSKGHMGMGGFDIFSAAGNKSTWSTPQNLKSPVNSPRDDFFLSMYDDENGYFSSNRVGGKGDDDIYTYFLKREVPVVVSKVDVVNVMPIVEPKKAVPIATPMPAPAAVAVGRKFVVYYDFNKNNIREDASKTLDELIDLMEKFPAVKVVLLSYTDPIGNAAYNLDLSKKRATSAMDYMISKGVLPSRITTKGNGIAELSKQCFNDKACMEKQRQLSRRTEVVIYSN